MLGPGDTVAIDRKPADEGDDLLIQAVPAPEPVPA